MLTNPYLWQAAITIAALLSFAGFLHLVGRFGLKAQRLSAWLCCGFGLDLVVTYFTVAPWIVGAILHGWLGVVVGVGAQVASVMTWTVLHELANRKHTRRGQPRIVHVLNRSVGRVRNHTAVWWTAWAVPIFWVVRVAEWFIYPPLVWLVRFPRYNHGEWVHVSRQKFRGLVGHDLIWCLYCDWMTGVWSLGAEMLRNVESFWCPIRFDSTKKCENCRNDFPDIHGAPAHAAGGPEGWVASNTDVTAAASLLERKYPPGQKVNSWFGHPVRLTIDREEPPAK